MIQGRKYTRAKGKTDPKKYNCGPDITRRGNKCHHHFDNLIAFCFLFFVLSVRSVLPVLGRYTNKINKYNFEL